MSNSSQKLVAGNRKKEKFGFKAFITWNVFFTGLIIATSGIFLYVAPPGGEISGKQFHLLGLNYNNWLMLHTNFAFLFIIFAVLHLYLNWRIFLSYLKDKSKRLSKFAAN